MSIILLSAKLQQNHNVNYSDLHLKFIHSWELWIIFSAVWVTFKIKPMNLVSPLQTHILTYVLFISSLENASHHRPSKLKKLTKKMTNMLEKRNLQPVKTSKFPKRKQPPRQDHRIKLRQNWIRWQVRRKSLNKLKMLWKLCLQIFQVLYEMLFF